MPDGKPASLSIAKDLDAVCDRFEADWRAGKSPRIEDVLAQANGSDPEEILRALLAVELDIRRQRGERVSTAEYKKRFPDHTAVVVAVFRELAERSKSGVAETSARPGSTQEEKKLTNGEPSKQASTKSGSSLLAQVYGEVRHDALAAVEATVRKSRTRWWLWLAAPVTTALIAVLGFYFFGRTPTAIVTLNVGVDLNDKTLSFVLDGKPIEAEKLAGPIELTIGEHELIVNRGDRVVKRMRFLVSRDSLRETLLQPVEVMPPSSPEPQFVSLFNGKDLSGWKFHPIQRGVWTVEDGCLTCRTQSAKCLYSEAVNSADFHLRAECRTNRYGYGRLIVRAPLNASLGAPNEGYGAVIRHERPNGGQGPYTGSVFVIPGGYFGRKHFDIKSDEWFTIEMIGQGKSLKLLINGELGLPKMEVVRMTRDAGHVCLQAGGQNGGQETRIQFRNIELKQWSPDKSKPTGPVNDAKAFQPQVEP